MGVYDLGLSNEVFWGLTLRQFVLLADRHTERLKREDRRAGELWALYANARRDEKRSPQPWTWLDLFPEWREPVPEQSEEQMLVAMDLWTRVKPLPVRR